MSIERHGQIYLAIVPKSPRGSLLKIGYATLVQKRLEGLREEARAWTTILGYDAFDLVPWTSFAGSLDLEKYLHTRWSEYRIYREWYRFAGDLMIWADQVREDPEPTRADYERSLRKPMIITVTRGRRRAKVSVEAEVFRCPSCWGEGKHREFCWRKK